jgi:hypothetical protein
LYTQGEWKSTGLRHDKALHLLEARIEVDLNSTEAAKVLRKIDWIVLPMMCAVYTFMLIDKSSLSFAAIMDLKTDLHLTGDEYSWLGSLV